jgi:hypothetical protein
MVLNAIMDHVWYFKYLRNVISYEADYDENDKVDRMMNWQGISLKLRTSKAISYTSLSRNY